jgi:hypothetical protein
MPHGYIYTNAYSNCDSHLDGDIHAYSYCDCDSYGDGNLYAYTYPNNYRNRDADSNPNADANSGSGLVRAVEFAIRIGHRNGRDRIRPEGLLELWWNWRCRR